MVVCAKGHLPILQYLLENTIINKTNTMFTIQDIYATRPVITYCSLISCILIVLVAQDGKNSLMFACLCNHIEIVKYLCEKSNNLWIQNLSHKDNVNHLNRTFTFRTKVLIMNLFVYQDGNNVIMLTCGRGNVTILNYLLIYATNDMLTTTNKVN